MSCRLDAATACPGPSDDAPDPPFDAAARGQSIWAGGFLEDLDVQRLLGHRLLQRAVLLFHLPQLLGYQQIHPPYFVGQR